LSRTLRWVSVVALAGVVLVACGDDDDDGAAPTGSTAAAADTTTGSETTGAPATSAQTTSAPPSGPSTTVAAKPTGEPIKLMVIHEVDAGAANPEITEGAEAAARAINDAGGVDGRPIEILDCDTENDPNTAAECGRRAVSEHVVAVVGAITPHDGEFVPLLEQNKIPAVGQLPLTAASFTSPAVFAMEGGSPTNFAGLATALVDAGATTISLARIDLDAAAALGQFAAMGLTRHGLSIVHDVPVPLGAPDMSPYAAAALADGVDGVIIGVTAQDAINLIQAIRQVNPSVKIAMIATEVGDVIEALGAGSDGLLRSVALTDEVDTARAQQYADDMAAAGFDDTTGFRINGWASVRLVADVAADLPDVTAAAVFDALDALDAATSIRTGVSAPVQWQQAPVPILPRVFNWCMLTLEVKGGENVPTTGKFTDVVTGQECPSPE
jgi:branched-chain amino acid transport system substrate-binding protein